jgi:histidyl-tRNA synthetase
MSVEKCKGTRDMTPSEMVRFRVVENAFRNSCLDWGYDEVRTPTIEYLYLFTAAGTLTPGRLGKVYSFLDWDGWSGERVVLRPDGTIPIARYYIETTGGRGLAKLFYVSNVFSFEETGTETREKWQCGAELIGAGSPTADVELVLMALETLGKLDLDDIEVRLSHAGLIRAILSKINISHEAQAELFDRVLDGDTQSLVTARPELARVVAPLLSAKGRSAGFLRNVSVLLGHDLAELREPLDDFARVAGMLDSVGTPYEIDIASGRGFEYYTGLIFQLWSGGQMVAGGGRYDALIPLLGGQPTPASGFALYVDKLMSQLNAGTGGPQVTGKVIVRTPTVEGNVKEVFDAVAALHASGIAAEVALAPPAKDTAARWALDIRDTGWRYVLWDVSRGNHYEMATVAEVIARIRE